LENGICCKSLGVLKPFINAEFAKSGEGDMSDIEMSIKKKFDNDLGVLANSGKIGVDGKIRNLVKENPYFW
jgi:hypothetical protein